MPFSAGRKQPNPVNGFILIEVLVSLAVFSVGILAVLTGILSTLNLQKDTALRCRAGLILQEQTLQLNEAPYGGGVSQGVSSDGIFQWKITAEPWSAAPMTKKKSRRRSVTKEDHQEMAQVRVEVSWQSPRGPRMIKASQLVRVLFSQEDNP